VADAARRCRFHTERTIELVGLPQMKLAWMIAKCPMPELEIIADTYLSLGTPVQLAPACSAGLAGNLCRSRFLDRALGEFSAASPERCAWEAGWYAIVPVADEEETTYELLARSLTCWCSRGIFTISSESG